jgi:hypothetical protein
VLSLKKPLAAGNFVGCNDVYGIARVLDCGGDQQYPVCGDRMVDQGYIPDAWHVFAGPRPFPLLNKLWWTTFTFDQLGLGGLFL